MYLGLSCTYPHVSVSGVQDKDRPCTKGDRCQCVEDRKTSTSYLSSVLTSDDLLRRQT